MLGQQDMTVWSKATFEQPALDTEMHKDTTQSQAQYFTETLQLDTLMLPLR